MKVWFFVEIVGGPAGTVVLELTSIGDHKEGWDIGRHRGKSKGERFCL